MKIRTHLLLQLFFGVILQGLFIVQPIRAAASEQAKPAAKPSLLSLFKSKVMPTQPAGATPTSTPTTSTTDKAKALFGTLAAGALTKALAPKDPNAPEKPSMMAQIKAKIEEAKQTANTLITTTVSAAKDTANAAVNQTVGAAKDVAANTQLQLQQAALNAQQQAQGLAAGMTVDSAPPGGPGLMDGLKTKLDGVQTSLADGVKGPATTPSLGGLTDKLKGAASSLIGSGKTSEAAAGKMAQLELLFKKGRDGKISSGDKEANLALIKDLMTKQSANELSAGDMTKLQGLLHKAKNTGLAPVGDLDAAIAETKKHVSTFNTTTKETSEDSEGDSRKGTRGKSAGKKADTRDSADDDRRGNVRRTRKKGKASDRDAGNEDRSRDGKRQTKRSDRSEDDSENEGRSRRRKRKRRGDRRRQRRKGKSIRSEEGRKKLREKIRNIKEGRSQGRRRGALPNTKASLQVLKQQKSVIKQQKRIINEKNSIIDQLNSLKAGQKTAEKKRKGPQGEADQDDSGIKTKEKKSAGEDGDTSRRTSTVKKRSADSASSPSDTAGGDADRRKGTVKRRSSVSSPSDTAGGDADRRKGTITRRNSTAN